MSREERHRMIRYGLTVGALLGFFLGLAIAQLLALLQAVA